MTDTERLVKLEERFEKLKRYVGKLAGAISFGVIDPEDMSFGDKLEDI